MTSPDTLFDALVALRASGAPLDPRHDGRWRTIEAWLRATFPATGVDAEDARQETLIAIGRNVLRMEASAPLQAVKWVATIHRRKKVDGIRVRSRDPVQRGLERRAAGEEEGTSLIERLEGEDERAIDVEVIERIVGTIEEHVAAHLEETEPAAAVRHLRRLQARAALRRLVLEAEFEELVAALDADEPLSRDRVYKWVERGRAVVIAALDRWVAAEGESPNVAEIAGVVREEMTSRRVDA
ncbi:MAG: hypothetical protein M3Y87_30155, partial [Myxococcota bacterium]|nr:hypothetical protein [Myxococcota bacterium]